MSYKHKMSDRVLGVASTARAVHAILLENGPEGPEVVRRFTRQRVVSGTGFEDPVPQPSAPKKESIGGGDDFTIEFGDSAASNNNLFMAAEFGAADADGADQAAAAAQVSTFDFELSDILAECSDAGYADASLAFALSAADAGFAEVKLVTGKKGSHSRDELVDALTVQHSGVFDDERVVFLPMTTVDEAERRYLAVFPKKVDPVSATLAALREGNDRIPPLTLVDAEVPVLIGLARAAGEAFGGDDEDLVQLFDDDGEEEPAVRPSSNEKKTLVVRAGSEDTLVLFLSGRTVHHVEILRSLTSFDQPETICSRVLLQQDEHGTGDIHHVLVLSAEHEEDLSETFETFFPDSKVERLRSYLPEFGAGEQDAATALVSASGAALRVLENSRYADSFEDINFLPKKLARRKVKLPLSWHMIAFSVLIVVTTLFFMTRYSTAETEIADYRERLENVAPEEVNTDITVLQARIDSMQHLYNTYTRAIEVLDTLLIGSDRWSRLLENTSKEASRVRGMWIESFQPAGGKVKISGNATSRDHVVAFASRVDGTIESLLFSEIRDWPVYSYTMTVPVTDSLPEAARYLRDNVRLEEPDVADGDAHTQNAADSQAKEVRL